MKHMAEASFDWQPMLVQIRALVKFLHNASWRKTIKRLLKGRADLDLDVLDSFSANLAKWRYETYDNVLMQLTGVQADSRASRGCGDVWQCSGQADFN